MRTENLDRRVVDQASCSLVMVDGTDISIALDAPISFAALRSFVSEVVFKRAIVAGLTEQQAKQRLHQATSALNRSRKGRDEAAEARGPLEAHLLEAQNEVKKSGNRKPRAQALLLLGLLEELKASRKQALLIETAEQNPKPGTTIETFHKWYAHNFAAWQASTRRTQLSLAKLLGVHDSLLSRWKTLPRDPNDNEETSRIVRQLEEIFGRPAGEGWSLITGRAIDYWPAEIPVKKGTRERISNIVGNIAGLSTADRYERRLKAYRHIQKEDSNKFVAVPYSLGKSLKNFPDQLRTDWTEFLQVHMLFEPLPDGDVPLVPKPTPSRPIDPDTQDRIYPSMKRMREKTAELRTFELSSIIGACVNGVSVVPKAPTEGEKSSAKSVVVLRPMFSRDVLDKLGLAIIACPKVFERYLEAHGLRKEATGKATDLSLSVVKAAGLMKIALKWLGQQPRFARRLLPVPGVLTSADVLAAQADWEDYCSKAIGRYDRIYSGEKGGATAQIDHAIPIEPILLAERPVKALVRVFLHHAAQALASNELSKQRAKKLENAVLAGIKANAYYRPETDRRLDWRQDGNGHLYRDEGSWRLRVPPSDLKNGGTKAGRNGDNRELADLGGCFYNCLEQYTAWARNFLLDGRASDALFVSVARNPRYTAKAIGAYWTRVSEMAMKKPHEDFHGCIRINSIGTRKIGATDAYNATKSYAEAGRRLVNDEKSSQVYVKVRPANETENSTAMLEAVNREMAFEDQVTGR